VEIADYVRKAIDDWARGELEPAFLHALVAVDGTAAKTLPGVASQRNRFVTLLDQHLWLIEPMLALGINLETTKFSWIRLKNRESRFSEVVYEVFRCNLAHGSPMPGGSGLTVRFSHDARRATLGPDSIELPDTVLFAMLAVAVFAPVNSEQRIGSPYFLSHAAREFVVDEWWGREADVRSYFESALAGLPRVTMNF
jgi:hypothetical protein